MKMNVTTVLSFAGLGIGSVIALKLMLRHTCIKRIDAHTAQRFIDENIHNPGFVILDIRPISKYTESHIDVALSIDFNSPSFRDVVNKLDKQKTYLVYSSEGRCGLKAAHTMKQEGFRHVQVLSGGYEAWRKMQDHRNDQESV